MPDGAKPEVKLTPTELGEKIKKDTAVIAINVPTLSVRKPSEILAMEFHPDDLYLFNGVLAKGQPATILGSGGVGKSRFVLQVAAAMITGREFLGMAITRRKIRWLFIQAENSNRRLQQDMQRLQAWVGPEDWKTVEDNLLVHTLEQDHDQFLSLNEHAAKERIARLIKEAQADIVVFDPLFAFGTGNLNTDSAMIETCKAIVDLARRGKPDCSVIVLHHTLTGKAGTKKAVGWDRASYGRGSKALQFWTRGQINIAPACADNNGKLVIACGKNSNGPEFEPFGIKLNPDTMIYEIDPAFDLESWKADLNGDAPTTPKPTPEAIAALVEALPLKRKALIPVVMETFGCEKSTAYTLIKKAEGKTIRKNAMREYEKTEPLAA